MPRINVTLAIGTLACAPYTASTDSTRAPRQCKVYVVDRRGPGLLQIDLDQAEINQINGRPPTCLMLPFY